MMEVGGVSIFLFETGVWCCSVGCLSLLFKVPNKHIVFPFLVAWVIDGCIVLPFFLPYRFEIAVACDLSCTMGSHFVGKEFVFVFMGLLVSVVHVSVMSGVDLLICVS